jgi:hypothetical protein
LIIESISVFRQLVGSTIVAGGSNPFTPAILFSGRLAAQGIQETIQKYVSVVGKLPKNPVKSVKIQKDIFKWTVRNGNKHHATAQEPVRLVRRKSGLGKTGKASRKAPGS